MYVCVCVEAARSPEAVFSTGRQFYFILFFKDDVPLVEFTYLAFTRMPVV